MATLEQVKRVPKIVRQYNIYSSALFAYCCGSGAACSPQWLAVASNHRQTLGSKGQPEDSEPSPYTYKLILTLWHSQVEQVTSATTSYTDDNKTFEE